MRGRYRLVAAADLSPSARVLDTIAGRNSSICLASRDDGMPEDFVIARNTEPGSTLPYLLRVPLGDGIILKAKDTWPGTGKVYCHRVEEWPVDAEIVERVAVRSCVRRVAAIDPLR